MDSETLEVKETIIGAKEQKVVSDGEQGTRLEDIAAGDRGQSSLPEGTLRELASRAIARYFS